jgi:uncharacterized membrane protein YedE/YeeE
MRYNHRHHNQLYFWWQAMMKLFANILIMVIGGAFFGFGLAISGMISPKVVLQFLNLKDFGLLLVMGGAVTVTFVFYQLSPRLFTHPVMGGSFAKRNISLDSNLVIGSAIFGIGWGISGVCPGPALAALGIGNFQAIWSLLGIFAGAYFYGYLQNQK